MHRAKHRADGDGAVLATTLIERFAATSGAPDAGTRAAARDAAALFGGAADVVPSPRRGDSPLFGAARTGRSTPRPRAARRGATAPEIPAPRVPALPFGRSSLPSGSSLLAGSLPSGSLPAGPLPARPLPVGRVRPQPVGAALSVTVFGAAAAVTAVVAPPTAVETTGSPAPVQSTAPASGPALATPAAAVPAPALAADRPTVQVGDLVDEVTAEMQRVAPAVETPVVEAQVVTVARSTALSSPAAMRKAAVSNALSRLGRPYRWGATGPNAFDCSGLVKWSFASAGRSLPRTSRALARIGSPVSRSNLQPGDLVFFYRPISHVGIYIGNGKVVHASRAGQPVKISELSRMKYTTARRV